MNDKMEDKKTMEVLIYTSFGLNTVPSCIRSAINENPAGPLQERTGRVNDKIREAAYKIENLDGMDETSMAEMIKEHNIVHCEKLDRYFYMPSEFNPYNHIKTMSIVTVDISKPWIISEYDGAESIQYFDIVDDTINFCRMK